MRKIYFLLFFFLTALSGCRLSVKPSGQASSSSDVVIERFDRVESLYLSMGDYAALHQLKTDYPLQTRTLVEDVLRLGPVNDPAISERWLDYFQDSTLQQLVADVERQYADLGDLNAQLTNAFRRLRKLLPHVEVPQVYAQISSLDQSIVVADSMLGISLDKYLGADYPAYLRYGYSEVQRSMMTRQYIVPDCVGFFLLSLYPLPEDDGVTPRQRHWHMSKIQQVVNQAVGKRIFSNDTILRLEKYVKAHPHMPTSDFLLLDSLPR